MKNIRNTMNVENIHCWEDLLGEPEVLVLDEPMNGLDPEGMAEMRNVLRVPMGYSDRFLAVVLVSFLVEVVALYVLTKRNYKAKKFR